MVIQQPQSQMDVLTATRITRVNSFLFGGRLWLRIGAFSMPALTCVARAGSLLKMTDLNLKGCRFEPGDRAESKGCVL